MRLIQSFFGCGLVEVNPVTNTYKNTLDYCMMAQFSRLISSRCPLCSKLWINVGIKTETPDLKPHRRNANTYGSEWIEWGRKSSVYHYYNHVVIRQVVDCCILSLLWHGFQFSIIGSEFIIKNRSDAEADTSSMLQYNSNKGDSTREEDRAVSSPGKVIQCRQAYRSNWLVHEWKVGWVS